MDSGQKNMSKEKKNISTLNVQKNLASLKIPTPPPRPHHFSNGNLVLMGTSRTLNRK